MKKSILDVECPPINTMASYLKEIERIPLLSRQDEEMYSHTYGDCCQKLKQENPEHVLCKRCAEAKDKLVTSNLRFVISIAKKYHNSSLSLTDLINEGNMGLLIAVDKFDHKLGYHFISYAVWWIKQSIMKAISEKSRMIRVPMNRTNELFKIAKFIHEYVKIFSKKPSEAEIEVHLNIPRSAISKILNFSSGHTSIEELVENKQFEKTDIPTEKFTPEQNIISSSLHHELIEILHILPEREKYIITHRFGLFGHDSLSLSKLGTILGITKERVRQLEKHALATIKKFANQKQMSLYLSE